MFSEYVSLFKKRISYIYKIDDATLFDIFRDKTFKETDLYNKCLELSNMLDGLSNKEILTKLID